VIATLLEVVIGPLKTAFFYIKDYWWTVTPFLFGFGSYWAWLNYKKQEYILSLEWVLLEIKPPADVEKSPKMAESIFAGLHSAYISSTTWKGKFFRGEVQNWFSFEIAGNGGEMKFYVKTLKDFHGLVENQIFAQYPEAEIVEVSDYAETLPMYLPDDDYDLFGMELLFAKPNPIPIKTYPDFEEMSGGKESESKRTDPLASLAEQISTLEPNEHIWVQYLIRGTGGGWIGEGKQEADKLLGKEVKAQPDFVTKLANVVLDFMIAVVDFITGTEGGRQEREEGDNKKEKTPMMLTGGERAILEAIDKKTAKLGFKSSVRFVYIGPKDNFHRSHISGTVGYFKQFYSSNLNSFRPNSKTMTYSSGWMPWLFPSDKGWRADSITYWRKRRFYQDMQKRTFPPQWIILNTEELATLWHLPGKGVKAPMFPRVEAKKSQPPAGLPIK